MHTINREGVFLPGWEAMPDIGLYMDQLLTMANRVFSPPIPRGEITHSMINNYVKSGLLPRPVRKRYEREHLALLMMIVVLKQALSLESIRQLLDALCRAGAQAGYALFCTRLEEIDTALQAGHVDLDWESAPPDERTLSAGILAALCTIHATRILEQAQKEGSYDLPAL